MSFLDQIVGSFSQGAASNPTVAMMDASFSSQNLPWRYVNCEVAPPDLRDAVRGAEAMGWSGFNCSMPHKRAVIPLLDQLSDTARICQAVNCVTRSQHGWTGHNTDGAGFLASLRELQSIRGLEVLIIGSGGAAHAIAVELALAGAALVNVSSRNAKTGALLASLIGKATSARAQFLALESPLRVPPGVRLIVNATPVGSAPEIDQSVGVDWTTLPDHSIVADVVVNPTNTAFLRFGGDAGATVLDGTGMLVNQAVENIRLWTGLEPDRYPMRSALDAVLATTQKSKG